MMTNEEYQEMVRQTSLEAPVAPLMFWYLGLAGETGEAAEKLSEMSMKWESLQECYALSDAATELGQAALRVLKYGERVKKVFRDDSSDYDKMARELGDILWYVTKCANALGYTLDEVMQMNADKLRDRLERGKIQGSGDER